MISIFEKNDAGFQHIIDLKGEEAYMAHTKSYLAKVLEISDYDACQVALEGWLRFFRTGHHRLTKTDSTLKKQVSAAIWPKQFVEGDNLTRILADHVDSENPEGVLGTWKNKDHRMLVVEKDGRYIGVVVNDSLSWKKGQIVFTSDKLSKSGTVYRSSFRPVGLSRLELLDKDILRINDDTYRREGITRQMRKHDEAFYRLKNSADTYAEQRDDSTVYLRIPSFTFNKKAIDSVLRAFDVAIRSTPNLLIDLRDCQGGQDNNFSNLMPYLVSGVTRIVTAELLSTKLNNQMWDEIVKNPDLSEAEKSAYKKIQALLNNNLGSFVNIFGKDVILSKPDSILHYPKNVGIIIHENNFSTTEQFILAAAQSRKVKLFGRKTGGALDVSNMVETPLSTGDFVFEYCISRSLRIPEMSVDDKGIHPDFYLDKSIGENNWVDFVASTLNSWL
ncbi:S41 family peptidase [Sphingobacterium paludis]|nr:S41 family peptidase [Sphingobacterium paludis]